MIIYVLCLVITMVSPLPATQRGDRDAVSTIENIQHDSHIVADQDRTLSLVDLSDLNFHKGIKIRNHIFRILTGRRKGLVRICSEEHEGYCLGLAKGKTPNRQHEVRLVKMPRSLNFRMDTKVIHSEGQKTVTLSVDLGDRGDFYLCAESRQSQSGDRWADQVGARLVLAEDGEEELKRKKGCRFKVSEYFKK